MQYAFLLYFYVNLIFSLQLFLEHTIINSFFETSTSNVFDMEAKDDGNDQWWDQDLVNAERVALKLAWNLLFLIITCGTLFIPMKRVWHPIKGNIDRYNFGMLASSMFLVGNILFIFFWYSISFGVS